ncbi:hypothetical protein ACIODS_15990 [Micromonospora chalcea]|uniref:hypothetical protein n=1 Tax=Micromonospora chalcea TaxID=1874 RepID=UPI00380C9A9F
MITRHTVGNALVLHPRERISPEARTVALSVDPDPDNDIVILDLQHELPFDVWDTVATELRRQRLRRGIRLVVCGARPETGALAGQWLSDRLGRPVIAPFGRMIPGAAGLLFVHGTDLGGWVCYRRGRAPAWQSKRYPAPAWDGAATDHLTISSTCAAEPLPGGVWLRDSRDEAAIAAHGGRLTSAMACLPHAMPVLVGCPGTAPLRLDDVARFWRGLAPQGREAARFIQYGPVALPDGEQFGQALADVLGCSVRVFTGVPTGRPDDPAMFTVTADGGPGWQVFARELAYGPRAALGATATPRILSHRAPAELGEPVGPGVYQYAHDAVVEVIPSGLWLRGPLPSRDADRIRAVPLDPAQARLVVDDPAPAVADRHRELAADLAARLDPATRGRTAVRPSSLVAPARAPAPASGARRHAPDQALVPPVPAPPTVDLTVAGPVAAPVAAEVALPAVDVAFPAVAGADARAGGGGPSWASAPTMALPVHRPTAAPARFQRTPVDEARGVRPGPDLDEERAWFRRAFRRQIAALAADVARVLAAHPALPDGADAREYATAVHLYLTAVGDGVDQALRSAEPGGHVPFARCVAAGTRPLPVHSGVTYAAADVTQADLRRIAQRRVLTDWGFTNALAEPPADLPGDVEVLIWSATGRRTGALETGDGVPSRVLFLPGTAFAVLSVREPAAGAPGRLLLRELSAGDVAADGRARYDALALAALDRHVAGGAGPGTPVPPAAARRFVGVPGLR